MPAPTSASIAAPPATSAPISTTDEEDRLLAEIYERVNPSVVNIRVTSHISLEGQPFRFELPEIPGFPTPSIPELPNEYLQQGEGSGFVWDKKGHIVTNNHVVEGADELEVTFYNDIVAPAKVVGTDPDSDLAVIKVDIDPEELHPVVMGDSEKLKVGQRVIAIGNPFGLEGTMTTGIISALGRSLPVGSATIAGGRYSIPDIIQTDAAINPGNSGGPLLNSAGEVIGVNTAIESPVRASAGIGFAVPASIVKRVVPALIENGHYAHPWIGITGTTLSPDLAAAMDLPENQRGALVLAVAPDSPAEKAGLRPGKKEIEIRQRKVNVGGDVIIRIDEQPVRRFDDLLIYLARYTKPGQRVTLVVLRENKEKTLTVTLGERPKSEARG